MPPMTITRQHDGSTKAENVLVGTDHMLHRLEVEMNAVIVHFIREIDSEGREHLRRVVTLAVADDDMRSALEDEARRIMRDAPIIGGGSAN